MDRQFADHVLSSPGSVKAMSEAAGTSTIEESFEFGVEVGDGKWDMGHGKWDMGSGTWEVGHGKWDMGSGTWDMGHGKWDMGSGTWEVGHGKWDMGSGTWVPRGTWRVELSLGQTSPRPADG
ncbi:hypothetical protein E6O75_ATG11103 [Venturia nashicola]|uniref:Uncharacterized protein n=1 Tax=Venturia nashicola TaxID=86259 RepID=A0A4Z1P6P6_9PEZI|nr:hypothetical protein E6O75_ATG11103 [Venturia nashicola]